MRFSARVALGTLLAATACLAYACSGTDTTPGKPDASEADVGAPVEAGSPDTSAPDATPATCGTVPTTTTKVNSPFAAWADKGPCTDQGCEEGSRVYEVFAKTETPLAPHRMDQCRLLSAIPVSGGYIDRWCCKQGCFAISAGTKSGEVCADNVLPDGGVDGGQKPVKIRYQCDPLPDGGYPTPLSADGNCDLSSNIDKSKTYCCGDFQ